MIVVFAIFLSVFVAPSSQSPTGAPTGACPSITPGHGGSSGTLPGGFFIYSDLVDDGGSYQANTAYSIRLEGDINFRGFLIQARSSGTTTPIGSFNTPSGTKHLTCSGQSTASVTHTNNNLKSSVEFTWTSPSTSGTVEFRYAVVVQNSGGVNTYYANINAADHRPSTASSSSDTDPVPTTTSTAVNPSTATGGTSTAMMNQPATSTSTAAAMSVSQQPVPTSSSTMVMPTGTPSACPSTNKNADSSFPIVFGTPEGCERTECTYYWAMGPNNENPSYLDIYMEGDVSGWLAVGFSENKLMTMTDVLGCRIVSGSNVEVIDSWNSGYSNVIDGSQDGVCTHMADYNGQRLKCLFSRNSAVLDAGQDFDLDNSLYIIRGYRTNADSNTGSNLMKHSATPVVSSEQYNPLKDSNTGPTSPPTGQQGCPSAPAANANYATELNAPGDDYYFGARVNDENSLYLDITLEGVADGWVGIGFSETNTMFGSDVFGCKREQSGDTVNVIDTWNPTNARTNVIDDTQSGICQHTAEYTDGRIKCTFSRLIRPTDIGQDLDLNDDLYQIYNAISSSGGSSDTGLSIHSKIPTLSQNKMSLATDVSSCPSAPAANANYATELNAPGDDFYFGTRVNDENSLYLDITLEGVADGWVGIGFSETNTMFGSDVFGCKREQSGDTVNVIDTWNPTDARTNVIDDTQSGICQHSAEYTDGRIKCTFSRLIQPTDIGQDLNLNDSLYQIYNAISSSGGSSDTGLSIHSRIPTLSQSTMSLATDALTGRDLEATEWPKKPLIQTHGVFMIISWILLAGTGIFFASWMKPILPNGEWFQVHRAVMVASLIVGVIGFMFAFIAHARNTQVAGIMNFSEPYKGVKLVHFIFGWIIILFHISNPIISIFRCAPGKPRRWIFNLIHGHLIGLIVFLFAICNIGMGIFLIEKSQGSYDTPRTLILYIIFVVIILCLQLVLFIVYTIQGMKAPVEDRPKLVHSLMKYFIGGTSGKQKENYDMTSTDEKKKEPDEKPPKKKPHENAPVTFSWISAAFHMILTAVVVLILIILIAVL